MRLTSSMHHFKQEISCGSKIRKDAIASMIGAYRSNRMKHRKMDIKTRLRDMKVLRDSVHAFLTDTHNKRIKMNAKAKQSRDDFMNNLRNSTRTSLQAYKVARTSLAAGAADVLGVKTRVVGNGKKKINPICDEKDNSFSFSSIKKTMSVTLSDEGLTKLPEEIPTDLPVEVLFELSEDIPDASRIENNPVPNSMDEILPPEQPAITETSSEASTEKTDMEQMVSAFISEAANGMTLSKLTEYVHLTDIACDAEALMFSMVGKGMIRKNKNRYYIV